MPDDVALTHLTITSSNDSPARDPRVWAILGSNDGVNFTPIVSFNDPSRSLWTQRNEVLRIDLPAPSRAFRYLRYAATATGGSEHALGEIEYFGLLDPPDSDNDGLLDIYEDRFAFLDKNNPADAVLDHDLDGLSNAGEALHGTDPGVGDSDLDGLSDSQEVLVHFTNPQVADSDGDGLSDGAEASRGSSPTNPSSLPDFTPVTWGDPANITGYLSDFRVGGTLVAAWTGGAAPRTIPGLGVTFQPGPSLGARYFGFDPYHRGRDADYEMLLQAGSWSGGPAFLEVPGLTPGQRYQVQVWIADTRPGYAHRLRTLGTYDAGDPVVTLDSGAAGNEAVYPGQHVTGTFIATHPNQILHISAPTGAQYNALMVRHIPLPDGEPFVAQSGFTGGSFVLHLENLDPAKIYQLQRGTSLGAFSDLGAPFAPAATTKTLTDPAPPPLRAFYRVAEVQE
jgi:hypothetical protein